MALGGVQKSVRFDRLLLLIPYFLCLLSHFFTPILLFEHLPCCLIPTMKLVFLCCKPKSKATYPSVVAVGIRRRRILRRSRNRTETTEGITCSAHVLLRSELLKERMKPFAPDTETTGE
ncbi:uncharacterized protein BO96DRAFT_230657 [Aspergillus niger CBS 101883]|uniref:uncharacterized protein n=1 Tax=Aspergillus lacticoffeatus (strain CBS 101883) TaxID=1450533 RepID=UPI000D7FAADD|nr:uncharacterized protein BO96DRAFT_230657 [Aspergillus niger CBS 101883]PYH58965.1 hypothetical protein BO96DRAFT_230657 [Aspergillus niger CBS 101883]